LMADKQQVSLQKDKIVTHIDIRGGKDVKWWLGIMA